MLTCLVLVIFTFYIQGVPKLKKNNSGAKGFSYTSIFPFKKEQVEIIFVFFALEIEKL